MSVIEYSPVAGLTIKEALQRAQMMATKENKTVVANINNIVMCITKKTDIDKTLQSYHQLLKFKYEIETIKREKQK